MIRVSRLASWIVVVGVSSGAFFWTRQKQLILEVSRPRPKPAGPAVHSVEEKEAPPIVPLEEKIARAQLKSTPVKSTEEAHVPGAAGTLLATGKEEERGPSPQVVAQVLSKEFDALRQERNMLISQLAKQSQALEDFRRDQAPLAEKFKAAQDLAVKMEKDLAQLTEKVGVLEVQKKAAEAADKKNLKRMGTMFAVLPADKAADIIKELDDASVTPVLSIMKEAEVAVILGQLPPKRAASLATRLSQGKK